MNELKYWRLSKISKERFRYTQKIKKKLFESKGIEIANYKFETVCDYFKILVNLMNAHFRLFDAKMTYKLFIHLYKNYININDNYTLRKYQEKKQRIKE